MQAILSEQEYQEYLKLKADSVKGGLSVDQQVAEQLEKLAKAISKNSSARSFLSANEVSSHLVQYANQIRSKSHLTNPPE